MNDREALAIVREAWRRVHGREPTTNELVFTTAIAFVESAYGRAPGQHAAWASRGLYTWGNLELPPPCRDGWVLGTDSGQSKCFLVRSTDVAAAVDYIGLLSRKWPVALSAMRTGRAADVVRAMKTGAAPYFSGDEGSYARLLDASAARIRKSIDGGGRTDVTIALLAMGALTWWLLRD